MLHAPTELQAIHAAFGTADALVVRRRAVYSAILELVSGRHEGDITVDLIDSPIVRAHLGEVAVDVRRYRPEALVPLSRLTSNALSFTSTAARIAVAGDVQARAPLEPVVRRIESELSRNGASATSIQLMLNDDPAFNGAARTVIDGLELAVKLCPELADDLMPHVALFTIMGTAGAEQLGSASVREYPGVIIVPQPASAIEVAEALVHEGAHQKFFDLGVTCSVFGEDFHVAPAFKSSWAPRTAPGWPLEQCVAAFHAYTCMATFFQSAGGSGIVGLTDFSLLPHAESRALELASWLLEQKQFLGPDGRAFVEALAAATTLGRVDECNRSMMAESAQTVVRRCCGWTLTAQMNGSIDLYWVSVDEA
ncbi:aKG-HExxH-type peptide beta-hydroxylase [Pseudonocardia charpentierae]|uniref:HEXXH motif-containing putative peptide modification protein n=1 Tax=Pseudonocardia charpentierae TaxID=3075545 RepID=A0ABU2N3X3_9PSEU|nr:HEXXH motif-containing putative peptide modification protein [Pseudonocardia sp. DSM 45834]MDT0347999.1 HEXXH motif-containing putative peptide modification protein [Pseudonocardia sp. DSM 45834]